MVTAEQISTLDDFIRSDYFESYRESIYSHMAINDSERFERVMDAASDGGEGSFHAEIIQDWREALSDARMDRVIDEETEEAITAEINACEKWHEANGSLWNQVG